MPRKRRDHLSWIPYARSGTLGDRTSLSATIGGAADFLDSFGYDALSQLLSITQMGQTGGNAVAPKAVDFAYNLDGQVTSALRYDPTTASPHPDIALGMFSYDTSGRLASINYTHFGNPIFSPLAFVGFQSGIFPAIIGE